MPFFRKKTAVKIKGKEGGFFYANKIHKDRKENWIKMEIEEYAKIDIKYPKKKRLFYRAKHFLSWATRLLVPDFLIGHPNLFDNLKLLFKNPQFKPFRTALTAWLIFTVVASSTGIYSLFFAAPARANIFWFDVNYTYRRQITIDITGNDSLSSGYAVYATLSGGTASDIYSKSLSNGNDFRVVYWDGANNTELDRVVTSFTSSNINFYFKTQTALSANDTTHYLIYYGYAGATNPLETKANVFNTITNIATAGVASASDNYTDNPPSKINDGFADGSHGGWGNNQLANSRVMIKQASVRKIWKIAQYWGGDNVGGWEKPKGTYFVNSYELQYSTDSTAAAVDIKASPKWTSLSATTDSLAITRTDTIDYANPAYPSGSASVSGATITANLLNCTNCWGLTTSHTFNPVSALSTRIAVDSSPIYIGTIGEYFVYPINGTDAAVEPTLSVGAEGLQSVPPDTPVNSLPSNSAKNQVLGPTLTSSAFSDPNEADTHAASQWQISTTSGNYSSPVFDSGEDASNLTSIAVSPALSASSTYYWHVRYKDDNNFWSDYSTETSFATSQPPSTPTNSLPLNGALNQKTTLTLTSSAFSDADAGSSHAASQWLVRSVSDPTYSSPVYDSGESPSAKTQISFSVGTFSENTTYIWKVKYKDDVGIWSNYSAETAFSTGTVPITVVAVGATEYTAGETAKLTVQVKDADGSAVNDATVTIDVFNPSGTKVATAQTMSYLASSNGLYVFNYTVPATLGVYIYDVTATYDGENGYSSHTFHVAQFASDITTIKTAVEDIQTDVHTANANLDILVGGLIVTQSAVNDASASASYFVTDLTNSTNDFYNNSVLTFTSGSLNGQVRRISDYNGIAKAITLDPALTSAPADNDTFTIVKQNVRVEEQSSDIHADVAAVQSDVTAIKNKTDDIYTLLGTVNTNLSSAQTAVNSIRTSQQTAYKAKLSDVSQVQTGSTYRAKLTLLDYEDEPVNAASTPTITIYDSTRTVKANAQSMTKDPDSTGIYSYTYSIDSTAATGLWEAVVSAAVGESSSQQLNDYFDVTGSPAQVLINSISDTTAPSIAADATITNEGSGDFEYHYEWCVVEDQDNQCGGNDDVYYASASKSIETGKDFNPTLSATVPDAGTYWFKLVVYYGTQASGASRQFTASAASAQTPVLGGGSMYVQTLTLDTLGQQVQNMQKTIGKQTEQLTKALAVLGITKPDVLSAGEQQSNSLKTIQNQLADLQAVSSSIRQVVEQNGAAPVVETYMKFNSVDVSFLITNPASSKQTVSFKSFLPAEVKSENIKDLDGLKLDFDANANSYYVSGAIVLGPKQTITKTVKINDIWVFENSGLNSIKSQAASFNDAVKNTQYSAQAVLLKNNIDDLIAKITTSQKAGYTSPQDHILAYRENKNKLQMAQNDLEKLKDLVVQAGASQGLLGKIGGIQTFATWGIIIAIIFGFLLMGAIVFSMWRYQVVLASQIIKSNSQILERRGQK